MMTTTGALFILLIGLSSVITTADHNHKHHKQQQHQAAIRNEQNQHEERHSSTPYAPLTAWDKLGVMLAGGAVVAAAVLAVVCAVCDGCPVNRCCCRDAPPEYDQKRPPPTAISVSRQEKAHLGLIVEEGRGGKKGISSANGGQYGTNGHHHGPTSGGKHQFNLQPRKPARTTTTTTEEEGKQQASFSAGGGDGGGESFPMGPGGRDQNGEGEDEDDVAGEEESRFMQRSLSEEASQAAAEAARTASGGRRGRRQQQMRKHVLQSQASSASSSVASASTSRKDSVMSTASAATTASVGSALSALSFGKQDKEQDTEGSSSGVFSRSGSREKKALASASSSTAAALASAAFALKLEAVDGEVGKLTITIQQVLDLPLRDYGGPCDPMLKISLHRDRRSLRKKSRQVLADFRTSIVKHESNPRFNETFVTEVNLADYKNFRLKLTAFDYDRHSKCGEIGSCSLLLKDVRQLTVGGADVALTNYLAQKKQEFGEILFGLSYLPTAQRLSISVTKAANLKYHEITEKLENFTPYVRVLQLNAGGKIIKKKKTNAKSGTKDPVFNETLTFDLTHEQLESAAFIVLVSNKELSLELQEMDSTSSNPAGSPPSPTYLSGQAHLQHLSGGGVSGHLTDRSDYSAPASSEGSGHPHRPHRPKDVCLGRVCVGARVRGERERAHWRQVLQQPRQVVSRWHTLH